MASVSEIKNYYNVIERKSNGAQFIEFDLHIHTPASYDFVMDKSKSEEENYVSLINDANPKQSLRNDKKYFSAILPL